MNQAGTDQSPDHAKLEDSLQRVQQELDQLQVNNRALQQQNKAVEANLAQAIVQYKINRLAMKLKCKKYNIPFPTSIGIPN